MNKIIILIALFFIGLISCNSSRKEVSFSEKKIINGKFYNDFIQNKDLIVNAEKISSFYPTDENSEYYKSEIIYSNQKYYAFLIAAHNTEEQVLQIVTKGHQEELQGTLTLFYENAEGCWSTTSQLNPEMKIDIYSYNCMKQELSKTDTLQQVILENGKVI